MVRPATWLKVGKAQCRLGNNEEAQEALNEIISQEASVKNKESVIADAICWWMRSELHKTNPSYYAAAEKLQLLLRNAINLHDSGNFETAQNICDRITRIEPHKNYFSSTQVKACWYWALSEQKKETPDYETATKKLEKAVEHLKPNAIERAVTHRMQADNYILQKAYFRASKKASLAVDSLTDLRRQSGANNNGLSLLEQELKLAKRALKRAQKGKRARLK